MNARVSHLFLAVASGAPVKTVNEAVAVEGRGFDGDRHHAHKAPFGARQLLIADAANLRALDVGPGMLKENAVLEGIAVESFPAGQRLGLGDSVVVELTGPCAPCHKVEAIRPGLLKESWGRRGQLARIIAGGVVRVGDPIRVLDVNEAAPKPIQPRLP